MPQCAVCGGELQRREFPHCGNVEYCSRCETKKYVRSKIYLNGKEVEYCVEVDTKTGEAKVLSAEEGREGG